MTSRMIGDFRVRCSVAQEENQGYRVEIWTRRIGGSAPEKCWTVPGQEPFATLDEAEQESRNLFEEINGVRFNGEPGLPMRPHNGWWRASSAPVGGSIWSRSRRVGKAARFSRRPWRSRPLPVSRCRSLLSDSSLPSGDRTSP